MLEIPTFIKLPTNFVRSQNPLPFTSFFYILAYDVKFKGIGRFRALLDGQHAELRTQRQRFLTGFGTDSVRVRTVDPH